MTSELSFLTVEGGRLAPTASGSWAAPPFPRHLDIEGREDGGRQGELADPGCPDARPWGSSNDGATRPFFFTIYVIVIIFYIIVIFSYYFYLYFI